jgi:acyl carrier protein
MMNYESEIRRFIAETFLFGEEKLLNGQESLLEAGIIDSTGVLELISHLEDYYHIKVNDDELVPENLDTIAAISLFLSKKMS